MPDLQERIETCLSVKERLTVGEVAILEALLKRGEAYVAISFVEERELQKIERKLGLN